MQLEAEQQLRPRSGELNLGFSRGCSGSFSPPPTSERGKEAATEEEEEQAALAVIARSCGFVA